MPKAKVLVVAFGSTIRSDDAAGAEVLKRLKHELSHNCRLAGSLQLDLKVVHEPLPELAAELAGVNYAVFVDASVELRPGELSLEPLEPCLSAAAPGHGMALGELLAACRALYGRYPRTSLLAIGAANFEFGETLSEELQFALPEAVRLLLGELERIEALSE